MSIDVSGSSTDSLAAAEFDGPGPLTVLADAIAETLGLVPSPEDPPAPAATKEPQWQIEAGA